MALNSLRLRRTLSVLPAFHRHTAVSGHTSHSICCPSASSLSKSLAVISPHWPLSSSSMASYSRSSFGSNNEDDKVEPDLTLFDGCDYNHWLIIMDFPEDPKPTPEEMVRIYEETCAKGLSISVEEAKKKMYACTTALYQGFQAVMTEAESEKFRGLPGVAFILPDSYIDRVNKEYGGDKYINGTIIPRPPLVQDGGREVRKYSKRNPGQPRHDKVPRSAPNLQQGSMQGNGCHIGASQNYAPQDPPQNYGPPGPGERRDSSPTNNYASEGVDLYEVRRLPMPSHQGNFNQRRQGSYNNDAHKNYQPQGEQRDYVLPPGQGHSGSGCNPAQGGPYGQGEYYGQGTGTPFGQGRSHGSYPSSTEGLRFSQGDQRNMQGEQRNYTFGGQTWNDQSPAMISPHWPLRSSSMASSSRSSFGSNNEDDKIGPNTILLKGCNYNRWLLIMDFPKDPKPTPEEMVQTYEETCAKGLNISVEEAKKKMYACSTTMYQGFQIVMTKEESEKFRGLPGVAFIFLDPCTDPVNKVYGEDKNINGTIIPRPPPIQYGGREVRKYSNRYERAPRSAPNWQGNPSFNQQGSMQGDGHHFGASHNYSPQGSPQSYGPRGPGERIDFSPMNNYAPEGRDFFYQGGRGPMPSHHGNYNQWGQGSYNYDAQGNYQPQGEQRDYVPPPGQGNFGSVFNPTQGGQYGQGGYCEHGIGKPYGQGQRHGSCPSSIKGQSFSQGDQRNTQGEQRNYTFDGQTWNDQGRF